MRIWIFILFLSISAFIKGQSTDIDQCSVDMLNITDINYTFKVPHKHLLFYTRFDTIVISSTKYYKDLSGHGFNLKIMDVKYPNDSVQLSLDTTIQRACLNAGCISQFYNTASVTTSNTAKTVLLNDLSQLYLDNYIFSNVTNKIFLIYSAEVTGNALNVILDRIGSRILKMTQWGNYAIGTGAQHAIKYNNKIFCIPQTDSDGVLIYDIQQKTGRSLGAFVNVATTHVTPFINMIQAPNGHFISFPYNETRVCDIDPVNEIVTLTGTTPPSTGVIENNYPSTNGQGRLVPENLPVLLFDNSYLMLPRTPSYAIKYNYLNKIISQISPGTFTFYSSNGYAGAVYIDETLVVAIPESDTKIININPQTGVCETYGTLSAGIKYKSFQKISDDLITCIPYTATSILNIHPKSKTTETFGTFTGSTLYQYSMLLTKGVLAGKILAIPQSGTKLLLIDPIAKTIISFGTFSGLHGDYLINPIELDNGHVIVFPY
jgi:hypothetical protein